MFGIEKSAKADGKENKKGETKIKRKPTRGIMRNSLTSVNIALTLPGL